MAAVARMLARRASLARRSPVTRSYVERSLPRMHGGPDDPDAEIITLFWKDAKSGTVHEKTAVVGATLLEAAHSRGIDLEGACEGSVACSTCHVILGCDIFDSLEEATEDEDDMLDAAFGLTETSRLGCQVR